MLYMQRLERSERQWIVKGGMFWHVCVGGWDVFWQHDLQQVGVCRAVTVTVQSQFKDWTSSWLIYLL